MVVKHAWKDVPTGWICHGDAPEGTTINLYFALKANREDALIEALYEVSNPDHERYSTIHPTI